LAYSAVPQPTAPPRAPGLTGFIYKFSTPKQRQSVVETISNVEIRMKRQAQRWVWQLQGWGGEAVKDLCPKTTYYRPDYMILDYTENIAWR